MWARSGRTCAGRQRGRALHHESGFSLVEALVGLLILGLILLFSLSTLYRLPRDLERLEARREAYRTVEAVLEAVRAGAVPMIPGTYDMPAVWGEPRVAGSLTASLEIREAGVVDLYEVTVSARYTVRGEPLQVAVETLSWSP